jgi:hypothetical protein
VERATVLHVVDRVLKAEERAVVFAAGVVVDAGQGPDGVPHLLSLALAKELHAGEDVLLVRLAVGRLNLADERAPVDVGEGELTAAGCLGRHLSRRFAGRGTRGEGHQQEGEGGYAGPEGKNGG